MRARAYGLSLIVFASLAGGFFLRFVIPGELSLNAYVGDQCTLEHIGDTVRKCCKFGPFVNCTTFGQVMHQLCEQDGIKCKSAAAACGKYINHMYNYVFIDVPPPGQWCLYDAQDGELVFCGIDPEKPDPEKLCRFLQVPLRPDGSCSCNQFILSDTPLISNRSVMFCQSRREGYQACLDCCNMIENILRRDGNATEKEIQDWYRQCSENCKRFTR